MSRPLLVLRPEPGASATALRARALGREAVVAPIFTVAACPWAPPDASGFDALMLTSANAVRLAGPALARYHRLPVYAVGAATGAAARAAGFGDVREGDDEATMLLALAAADGAGRLLHLTGREHRHAAHPAIAVERRIVYAADALDRLPDAARAALDAGAVALLHSPRAAATFAALVDGSGIARAGLRIAAISDAARDAAGPGWRAALAAGRPTDAALLAVAARLCD